MNSIPEARDWNAYVAAAAWAGLAMGIVNLSLLLIVYFVEKGNTALVELQWAETYLLEGNLREARFSLSKAAQTMRRRAAVKIMKGRIIAKTSPERALTVYQEVLDGNSDLQFAHYYLAESLAQLGRYEEARKHLKTTLDLSTHADAEVHPFFVPPETILVSLINLYFDSEDLELNQQITAVEEICRNALVNEPPTPLKVQLHICLGRTGVLKNSLVTAERHFAEVLAIAPRDPVALRWLGWFYELSGDLEVAEKVLSRSLILEPNRAAEDLYLAVVRQSGDTVRYENLLRRRAEGRPLVENKNTPDTGPEAEIDEESLGLEGLT